MGNAELGSSQAHPEPETRDCIYASRLSASEVRVACLSLCVDEVLHLNLRSYRRDEVPEYEAASYAWGGETGDYTKSNPIYVGKWWNVLWVTTSCRNLLRRLWLREGNRRIWIDAICINQDDMAERNIQINSMDLTYTRCSKAIAYLGEINHRPVDDEVRTIQERLAFGSQERGDGPGLQFPNILHAEYFRRVWIIQELIHAPSTLFILGNEEFTAQPRVFQDKTWTGTPAPWLQYLGSGSMRGVDLFELLRMTSSSKSGDPRDRVFGVLSMHETAAINDALGLQADYSHSTAEVLLGTAAYCLQVLKDPRILSAARGFPEGSRHLSWIPNMSWLSEDIARRKQICEELIDLFGCRPVRCSLPSATPWSSKAVIDRMTGALTLRLVRVFGIHFPPEPLLSVGDCYAYELKEKEWTVIFVTRCPNLHELLIPGQDHLFLLPNPKTPPPSKNQKGLDETWAMGRAVMLSTAARYATLHNEKSVRRRFEKIAHSVKAEQSQYKGPTYLILRRCAQRDAYQVVAPCCDVFMFSKVAEQPKLSRTARELVAATYPWLEMKQAFFGQDSAEVLYRVIWLCSRLSRHTPDEEFFKDYLRCIPCELQPELTLDKHGAGYVEFYFENGLGDDSIPDLILSSMVDEHIARSTGVDGGNPNGRGLKFEVQEEGDHDWKDAVRVLQGMWNHAEKYKRPVYVRVALEDIWDYFHAFLAKVEHYDHAPPKSLGSLTPFVVANSLRTETELRAGTGSLTGFSRAIWLARQHGLCNLDLDKFMDEAYNLGNPRWGQSLMKDFQVDGTTLEVTLL